MKRYFNDLETLNRFTLSLDCQAGSMCCQHCSKTDQFVSHGFVYKKHYHGKTRTVGKRLFCSNRSGHSGCGRTVRLYLVTEITRLHYTAAHITAFILALLVGHSTQQAYWAATQTIEPRHAYRWLNKLQRKLVDYRALIHNRLTPACRFTSTSKQRCIVLSTLQRLFSQFGKLACIQYQRQTQTAFI